LREDFAIGRKLKRQLRRNPVPWFAGAAVLGLLLSKLPLRRKKVVIQKPKFGSMKPEDAGKAGVAVALLNFAFQLAKPALLRFIRERFTSSFSTTGKRATRPREYSHASAR